MKAASLDVEGVTVTHSSIELVVPRSLGQSIEDDRVSLAKTVGEMSDLISVA